MAGHAKTDWNKRRDKDVKTHNCKCSCHEKTTEQRSVKRPKARDSFLLTIKNTVGFASYQDATFP